MTGIRVSLVGIGALAVVVCGGESGGTADGAVTADVAAETVDGVGTDAQPQDTQTEDIPPPVGVLRTSYIAANSYSRGAIAASSVTAGFYDQTPPPLTSTEEQVGDCVVRTTTFGDGGSSLTWARAGTLTISGGARVVTLTGGAGGYTPFQDSDAALWSGGETLTFAGSGGVEVPAFEGQLIAPNHVTVTAPPYPFGTPLTVDRDADLALAWEGSSAGELEVRVNGPQQAGEPQTSVRCSFAVAAGQGVVPAAALGRIVLAGTGTLALSVVAETAAPAAPWGHVRLRADVAALAPSGAQFGVAVDFL